LWNDRGPFVGRGFLRSRQQLGEDTSAKPKIISGLRDLGTCETATGFRAKDLHNHRSGRLNAARAIAACFVNGRPEKEGKLEE